MAQIARAIFGLLNNWFCLKFSIVFDNTLFLPVQNQRVLKLYSEYEKLAYLRSGTTTHTRG